MANRNTGAMTSFFARTSGGGRYALMARVAACSTLLSSGFVVLNSSPATAACVSAGESLTCDTNPYLFPIAETNGEGSSFTLNLNGTEIDEADFDAQGFDTIVSVVVNGGPAGFAALYNNSEDGVAVRSLGGNGDNQLGNAIVLRSLLGDVIVGGSGEPIDSPFAFGPDSLPSDFLIDEILVPNPGIGDPATHTGDGFRLRAGTLVGGEGSILASIVGGSITVHDGAGINADSFNGDILLSIGTDITSQFRAVDARADGTGNVGVIIQTDTSITGGNDQAVNKEFGIRAGTTSGSVHVINDGTVKGAIAINVESDGGGDLKVTGAGSAEGTLTAGIMANALAGGDVAIEYTGDITGKTDGVIAQAWGLDGNVNVSFAGAIKADNDGLTLRAGAAGNEGPDTGNGNVIVTASAGSITVQDGIGIDADVHNGNINLDVGADISSQFRAIDARASGTGKVDISIRAGKTIAGGNDEADAKEYGVFSTTTTGDINVVNNGAVTGATAINVESSGGDLNISGNGAVDGKIGRGIAAQALAGGDITIIYKGNVTGVLDGIFAQSLEDGGTVQVSSAGTVKSAGDGIFAAVTGGLVDLSSTGNITAGDEGYGFNAQLGPDGVATLSNAAVLEGGAAAVIVKPLVDGDIAKSVLFTNTGTIRNLSAAAGDLAITISSELNEGATINNAGTIIGRVDSGTSADVFNNTGTWQSSGTSSFGAGDDVLNNSGTMQLTELNDANQSNPRGFAVPAELAGIIDFGDGNDTFNNTGALTVTGGNAHLRNLETFKNSGSISMLDGAADDALYIDGTYLSGGTLGLDVSANSGRSDKLIANIISVDKDGPTRITVDVKGAVTAAGDEIVLVEADGANAIPDGAFELTGGSVNSGIFKLNLAQTADGSIVLRSEGGSTPPPPVSCPTCGPTELVPQDRGAGLLEKPGQPTVDAGGYVQIVGGTESRDLTGAYTNLPNPTAKTGSSLPYSDRYQQDIYGIIVGLDRLDKVTNEDGSRYAWVVGGFGGIVGSNVDFENSSNSQDILGGVVGGYYALAYGNARLHALVKADFGRAEVSTGTDKDKTGYFVPGFAINTGYRFNFGESSYVQPIATIAYANTSTGDLDLDGNHIEYQNTESLRGRVGARVASFIDGETHVYEPWLQASLWHEFDGKSQASFTGASGSLDFGGNGAGTFGEIGVGANIINKTGQGFSGNFRSDVSFGDNDLIGVSAKLGLEYRFPVQ